MHDTFDLLIRNASIVDGTGEPRYAGDIGVRGDRIARIGDLAGARGTTEIDLAGRIAAPGFIDAHTHDDRLLLSGPDMAPKVSQGVTTVIGGNCGISLAPTPRAMPAPVTPPLNLLDDTGAWFRFPSFAAYLDALRAQPAATNCAMLVGHSTLRVMTMDDLSRPADDAEIEAMRALVDEALRAGAIGVSTGLFYEPAFAAPTEEVIEVCRPLTAHQGLYCTHMRNEAGQVVDALEETFRIGRELGVPVVVSHHKVTGTANWGRSVETLARIGAAMQCQCVALDCYPYTAGSTMLHNDPVRLQGRVLIAHSEPQPKMAGRELDDIAREWGCDKLEAVRRLQPASAIYFMMDEADVQRILAYEHTMIGSDGIPLGERPHPRLWGTFPRVLGHYSRTLNLFPLETAVWKMTGLTARNFGLEGRGTLAEGAAADIVVFDADSVIDTATYDDPQRAAAGIEQVLVAGVPVWQQGRPTGARPGQVLRRRTAPQP